MSEKILIGSVVGPAGSAAGFDTPTATIDSNVGTPSVTITASGPDTAKIFNFDFKNLKGNQGIQGIQGIQGAAAGFDSPTATIDSNVGTPSVTITASGPDTAKIFNFDFKNLKGDQGIQGIQGPAGAGVITGGSVGQILAKKTATDYDTEWVDAPNSAVWGQITGTLSSQSDLNTALAGKADSSSVHSIPAGGTANQILSKTSATDYDVSWTDAPSGGSSQRYDVELDIYVTANQTVTLCGASTLIDWGDGSASETGTSGITHTYITAGLVTVGLNGVSVWSILDQYYVPTGLIGFSDIEELRTGKNVTSIGDNAFYKKNVRRIYIPFVTTVGNGAFYPKDANQESIDDMYCPKWSSFGSSTSFGGVSTRSIFGNRSIDNLKTLFVSSINLAYINTSTPKQPITLPEYCPTLNSPGPNYVIIPDYGTGRTTTISTLTNYCTMEIHRPASRCILSSGSTTIYNNIHVPYSEDHSILNAYKSANNWSAYADYLVDDVIVPGISTTENVSSPKSYTSYDATKTQVLKNVSGTFTWSEGVEDTSNKTTSISSSSTNTQYPSALAVYSYVQSLDGNERSY